MRGLHRLRTVRELMMHLSTCPADAIICIMPEDGEGIPVEGVLQFASADPKDPPEVWILMDEFGTLEEIPGPSDEDDTEDVQPVDSRVQEALKELEESLDPPDVIRIRGKLRSA